MTRNSSHLTDRLENQTQEGGGGGGEGGGGWQNGLELSVCLRVGAVVKTPPCAEFSPGILTWLRFSVHHHRCRSSARMRIGRSRAASICIPRTRRLLEKWREREEQSVTIILMNNSENYVTDEWGRGAGVAKLPDLMWVFLGFCFVLFFCKVTFVQFDPVFV